MLSTRSKHIKRGNGKKTKKHYGGTGTGTGTGTGGASVDKELYRRSKAIVELLLLGIITIAQARKRVNDELKKHNSNKCCTHFKEKMKTGTTGSLVKALEKWFTKSHSQ